MTDDMNMNCGIHTEVRIVKGADMTRGKVTFKAVADNPNDDRNQPRSSGQRTAILLDNRGTGDYSKTVFGAPFTDMFQSTAIYSCICSFSADDSSCVKRRSNL